MLVDHGFTQLLDILFDGPDQVPVLPVFINCGSDFRPPMHRVLRIGEAVGRFLKGLKGRRILILGTGGLSHDPPIPAFRGAPDKVQQTLIEGIDYTPEKLDARNTRVIAAAEDFAKENKGGYKLLNEDWDRQILDLLENGRFAEMADYEDDWIYDMGGCGGQEIRMWLAACAAFAEFSGDSSFKATVDYYRCVPELFVAYSVAHAAPIALAS